MDQKIDHQKEAKKPIAADPREVMQMLRGKTGLPPEVTEAIERQQAQMFKDRRNNLRATLAATIAGGFAASTRHVSIEAMALDSVEAADKILGLVES